MGTLFSVQLQRLAVVVAAQGLPEVRLAALVVGVPTLVRQAVRAPLGVIMAAQVLAMAVRVAAVPVIL